MNTLLRTGTALLLICFPVATEASAAPNLTQSESPGGTAKIDEGPVAWGNGLRLSRAQLDPILVSRYAMTGEGRSALDHLLKARLLDRMALERHLEVGEKQVDERVAELDRQLKDAGESGGIDAQLRDNGVDETEFRELLRVSIVQEKLCREALGIPPGSPVSGGQQELWIEEEMAGRGITAPPPPWTDGIAGRCGDLAVTAAEYRDKLRRSLPIDQLRETCYQLMLAEGIRARMPDLSTKAYDRAVAAEIERRRLKAKSNPAYKEIPFEKLLSSQGLTLESLKTDPAVVITALSQLWVLRTHSESDLQRSYREERLRFDGVHGEAVNTHVIFLKAAAVESPSNPRRYEQADAQLEQIAREIASLSGFEAAARRHSEDPETRAKGGELGWLRRVGPRLEELRAAVFEDLKRRGPIPATGRILGPVRTENGVALVWLSGHRAAPSWETMREHVRNELRRKLIIDVLPRESLVTFLDA